MLFVEDEIINKNTKDYLKEVIITYDAGCYRSANVLLYSIVIYDLIAKLIELKEVYYDKKAIEILESVNLKRKESVNPEWENYLIERLSKETNLISPYVLSNIEKLKQDRNFSAHPALSEDYSLIKPTKETTLANINNMIDGVFSKPSLLISQVTDFLLDDLKTKNEIYSDDIDALSIYLNKKYYSKLNDTMKVSLYKSLWKICFILKNEDCDNNRKINRNALIALTNNCEQLIVESCKLDSKFDFKEEEECRDSLFFYLNYCPNIYKILTDEVKYRIKKSAEKDELLKSLSWFIDSNLKSHLVRLTKNDDSKSLYSDTINLFFELSKNSSFTNEFYDFCIASYGRCRSYNSADMRFQYIIQPYLNYFDEARIIRLIEVSNSNDQIYNRLGAVRANNLIISRAKKVLQKDFDYSKFNNFKFSIEVFDDSESETINGNISIE